MQTVYYQIVLKSIEAVVYGGVSLVLDNILS